MGGAGLAAPFTFKGGTYPGTGGTCIATLAAAGTCTVVVTYSPTTTGAHTDTIDITYNDGNCGGGTSSAGGCYVFSNLRPTVCGCSKETLKHTFHECLFATTFSKNLART